MGSCSRRLIVDQPTVHVATELKAEPGVEQATLSRRQLPHFECLDLLQLATHRLDRHRSITDGCLPLVIIFSVIHLLQPQVNFMEHHMAKL